MSKVTVSQLAEVLGVDVSKLLVQLSDAGIEGNSGDDAVSNDDKKKIAGLFAGESRENGNRCHRTAQSDAEA